ncbi:MAG TPA: enoyl-ACP reductase FabV [Gammaproteobacteria bacterium]|nr:enoyl-ACP reductase FabV [Gammaproteobacteria bacterium]
MLIEPKVRGFICTTAHPEGCALKVEEQIDYVRRQNVKLPRKIKNVLIIGSSTGYGLASRVVAGFGLEANTIGVFFERPAADKRTASAGWYNTAAFEARAHQAGLYARSFNGDAFTDAMKQQVIDCIRSDWNGKVDLVIYSLAAPRRQDPTGAVYSSVLKPIGRAYEDKTLDIMSGAVSNVSIEPATEEEIAATVKVMGGEDWALWMQALMQAGVLAENATTIAYTYIGPEMTYQIYHEGTIGRAKQHLEMTARELDEKLAKHCKGRALISVNKALVTQASSAIPVVPLYMSILYKVMKQKELHEGCIEQMWRLFADYLCVDNMQLDAAKRIRLDNLEMRQDVQAEVLKLWPQIKTDNLNELSDIEGYRKEFYQLFGFAMDQVDYAADVDINVAIPSIQLEMAE